MEREEPGEVRTFARAEERCAHAPDQTPCKRVRLTQAEEGDAQTEVPGWPEAEEAINGSLARLGSIEATLGAPAADRTAATLWGCQAHAETRLGALEDYISRPLAAELTATRDLGTWATRVAADAHQKAQMLVGAGGANAIIRPLKRRLATVEGYLKAHIGELRCKGPQKIVLKRPQTRFRVRLVSP